MKRFRSAACAFLVACVVTLAMLCCSSTHTIAQPPTVPPTFSAPEGTPMVTMKWEYKIHRAKLDSDASVKDAEKEINKLGGEMWELVSVTSSASTGYTTFIFKRVKGYSVGATTSKAGSVPMFTPK